MSSELARGSGVGRDNKKGEEGDAALALLALCDYIH
jgi:hypothetical protein